MAVFLLASMWGSNRTLFISIILKTLYDTLCEKMIRKGPELSIAKSLMGKMNGSLTAELIWNPYLLDIPYNGNQGGGMKNLNYTYEELERDVKIGHEIEIEGKTYGIINVPKGRGLGEGQKRFNYFKTAQELLDNGTIEGKLLKGIWGEVEFLFRL